MIHLLYGEDDFSLEEYLTSIKATVKPPDLIDVNTTVLDGNHIELDELISTCDTVPFLTEKRLVIVNGLLSRFERRPPSKNGNRQDSNQKTKLNEWQGLTNYLDRIPDFTDLVFVDTNLSGSNRLLAAIRPYAKIQTFVRPSAERLKQWIVKRVTTLGTEIDHSATRALAQTVGNDLRTLSLELEKLAVYRRGHPIREDDVRILVPDNQKFNIFAAVDSIIEGRSGDAMKHVHEILQSSYSSTYILVMMSRQVRLLIMAKDLMARGVPSTDRGPRLGLTGYPLRKTLEQADKFSTEQLINLHRKLLDADLAIKTGMVDVNLVLDVLIADIASDYFS